MIESQIEALFVQMQGKDNNAACGAMRALMKESCETDAIYPYFLRIAALLSHKNSLMRNRALLLLANNARWDEDNLFDGVIDAYISHINDEKPITARQCIQSLPEIAAQKPRLAERIVCALSNADVSRYADSMRPLLQRDIENTLQQIAEQSTAHPVALVQSCDEQKQ